MQDHLKDKCNREFKSLYVKHKREKMGLNQRQFTDLLGLGESGDRTIRGWESGEHTPSPSKWELLQKVTNPAPYRNFASKSKFEFIDQAKSKNIEQNSNNLVLKLIAVDIIKNNRYERLERTY